MHGFAASPDEARDITIGHQLIYELWHGGGSPYYETFLSGAPDVFPPLAAVADHFGGLAAVRLMNLTFMLMTTALLFFVTRRLFGYGQACASIALFAGLGLTHDIGVYGNYDALALLFLAAASYCAIRSQEKKWLLLVAPALLIANAAKYMSVVFDPVVICIAACQAGAWSRRVQRVVALAAAALLLLLIAAYLAGGAYVRGIFFTTLARPEGANVVLAARSLNARGILIESSGWIGLIIALGLLGIMVAAITPRERVYVPLLIVLVVAGLLVTVEALHLHSDESMRQHDAFGAWFACIAAGYALAAIARWPRWRWVKAVAVGVATALVTLAAVHSARTDRASYPLGTAFWGAYYALAKPYLQQNGRYLIDEGNSYKIAYEDHVNIQWFDLVDDNYIKYPIPGRGGDSHGQIQGTVCEALQPNCMYLTGVTGYRAAIRAHWFVFISLYGVEQPTRKDRAIARAVQHTPGYVPITGLGAVTTWIYAPAYRALGRSQHRR